MSDSSTPLHPRCRHWLGTSTATARGLKIPEEMYRHITHIFTFWIWISVFLVWLLLFCVVWQCGWAARRSQEYSKQQHAALGTYFRRTLYVCYVLRRTSWKRRFWVSQEWSCVRISDALSITTWRSRMKPSIISCKRCVNGCTHDMRPSSVGRPQCRSDLN